MKLSYTYFIEKNNNIRFLHITHCPMSLCQSENYFFNNMPKQLWLTESDKLIHIKKS